jgi:hypothetical protein
LGKLKTFGWCKSSLITEAALGLLGRPRALLFCSFFCIFWQPRIVLSLYIYCAISLADGCYYFAVFVCFAVRPICFFVISSPDIWLLVAAEEEEKKVCWKKSTRNGWYMYVHLCPIE